MGEPRFNNHSSLAVFTPTLGIAVGDSQTPMGNIP